MKKMLVLAGMAAMVFTACSKDDSGVTTGANNNMTVKNQTDMNFMMGVAMSNTAEVSLGQLAATRGTNAGVRQFGQLMVNHHTMAQSMLRMLGDSVQSRVPDSMRSEMQALAQRLSTLTGRTFDTAYMNSQVMSHQMTLGIFQSEISGGQNMWIKNFSSRNVGMIQQHLTMADSIRRTL